MTAPLLSVRGGRRVYSGEAGRGLAVTALDEIDLDIHRGEFVAIVGPSGGGKSTLLSVLGLLDDLSDGEYLIDGVSTSRLSERDRTMLRCRTMAFVFQSFHLLERRPAVDSAELALLYQGVSRTDRRRRAADALAAVGLADKTDAEAATLSGGQRQRVAVARAMAARNPVILADEPTGNLDTAAGEVVLDELIALHRLGATVVVVTHSEAIARRAKRILRIEDGRIVDDTGSAPRETAHSRPDLKSSAGLEGHLGRGLRLADLIADAMRSVLSRKLQSLALLATVAVAVGTMVVTLGIASSAHAQVSSAFDAHTNREVGVTVESGVQSLADAVDRVAALAGVESVAALSHRGDVTVESKGIVLSVELHGVAGDFAAATRSQVTWLGDDRRTLQDGEVVVGGSLARQLHIAPIELSPEVTIEGRRFVIVGLIEGSDRFPLLAGEIVVDEATATSFGQRNQVEIAVVTTAGAAAQVGHYVPAVLDPHRLAEYAVHVPTDPQSLRQEVEAGVQATLAAFTALMGIVAVFVVGNTLMMSVFARRSELALRRAVGGRAGDLGMLVAVEASYVGFVGGAVGLALGLLCILGFTISQRWLPVFDLWLVPLSLATGLVLAAASSVVPAMRAARVVPVIALRS